MRFLIDNALSPQLAAKLAAMGHDAIHVREIGIASSSDEVILLRRRTDRRPARQAAIILANLSNLADSLQQGCIAIIEESRVRVRLLPIAD